MRTNTAKGLRRALLLAVLEHGQIETTAARARAIQGDLEKIINLLKKDSVTNRRLITKELSSEKLLAKIPAGLSQKYLDRRGGYSRIIKLGPRLSDSAQMVRLELV